MKKRVLIALMGTFLFAAQAFAQQKTVTGKVTDETGAPLAAASVVIKGTSLGTQSNAGGSYTVLVTAGQVLQFRLIG
ncbi:MAG TPA: carboxypeptidase-like regulatory domain-containing protein, partial [Gemmatimonadaceae bacterium]